jgi:SOS response regulatory protein OraA/RecX
MLESSQKSSQRSPLLKYATRLLSSRPYFRSQLHAKLSLRAQTLSFEDAGSVIEAILEDLSRSGYLDDQYLAQAYVRRQLSKGYGPKVIAFKLKYLGLAPEITAAAIQSEASQEAELLSLKRYCRKFPRLERQKLISKLYYRGYLGPSIKKAFDGDWLAD